MKLEDQRIMAQKNDDSIDPQFLTFRYHTSNNQTSPRAINSQRLQYKSLERYPFLDFPISQCEEVEKQRKIEKESSKQLRSVKSQERLAGIRQKFSKNNDEVYEEQGSEEKRNRALKKALNKLRRNIEREKRADYDEQIQQLKRQLVEDNQELKRQIESIEQLYEICEYNIEQCEGIKEDIHNTKTRNKYLMQQLQQFQKSVESEQISIQTSRQQELRNGACINSLKQGIREVKEIRSQVTLSVSKLKGNINEILSYMNEIESIDGEILNIQTGG